MEEDRLLHLRALNETAQVATMIAEMFKPCLGPSGATKLVEDADGLWLSSSPSIVLERAGVQHPVAKILLEATDTITKGVGDGSRTFVILVGELLKGARDLVSKGIHPNIIVDGWKLALDYCMDKFQSESIDRNNDLLWQVARTVLSSGISSDESEWLATLVADAIVQLSSTESLDLSNLSVERQAGGSPRDSFLVKGIALRHELGDPFGPKSVENATIAIVKGEIMGKKPPSWRYETILELSDAEKLIAAVQFRNKFLIELSSKISDTGANVLAIEKGVDPVAMSYLTTKGTMVIRRVVLEGLVRIAKATGGNVVNHVDDLTRQDLGFARLVESRKVHGQDWTFIEGCTDPKAVTLVVRAQSETVVHAVGRLVERGLKATKEAHTSGRVVFGGGAFEESLAHRLRAYASEHEGRQQLAIRLFAEALESIPMTLAKNAGLDALVTLTRLRSIHAAGEISAGVDQASRGVGDMRRLGVLEPFAVKRRVLVTAFGVATLLLRVDSYLYQPRLRTKKERFEKERKKYLDPERVKKMQREHGID